MTLPLYADELTAEWLTGALQGRFPGVEVASVDRLSEISATNHHVRLGLTFAERAGAPDTVFAKMASPDPAHRAAIGATGMGAREARFYADLAGSVDMRVPEGYYADTDEDGAFLLLLEDLSVRDCQMSDGTWGISADLAAGAMADLASLHVRFEDAERLDAVRPWVTARPAATPEFTAPMLRQVIDANAEILSDAYVEVAELYIADPQAMIDLWDEGPQTLIHGDTHIGNVFVDGDRVGFLDWGLMAVTTPMRDVSYFLTMSMLADERRPNERDLIAQYLEARRALGGGEISFDDAWEAHRVHTGYTVLASFLSLVPPYSTGDQKDFGDRFRERSIAALDDLDVAPLLRQRLQG